MRYLLVMLAIGRMLLACDNPAATQVQFDLRSMQHHARLNAALIDDLRLTIRGEGMASPIEVEIPPDSTSFDVVVRSGPQRHFLIEATRNDGGPTLPVYLGETRADLAPGDNVEVVIPTFAVGTLSGTVTITNPELALPQTFSLGLRAVAPVSAQPEVVEIAVEDGTFEAVVISGEHTVELSLTDLPEPNNLANLEPFHLLHQTIQPGQLTQLDIILIDPEQRCHSYQPQQVLDASGCLPVSVHVSGLAGSGLRISNNETNLLEVTSNGQHMFNVLVPGGAPYAVAIDQQPTTPTQHCVLGENAMGDMPEDSGVTVTVECTTLGFTVSGVVHGTADGMTHLTLTELVSGQVLENVEDGVFSFSSPILSGQPYHVVVSDVLTPGLLDCTVLRHEGIVGAEPVDDIAVYCLGEVRPLYDGGAQAVRYWNYYVENDNGLFASSGIACHQDSVTGYDACLHAGAMRSLTLRGESDLTCSDIVSIDDAIGAFDWHCDDSGPSLRFISTGLRKDRRLLDLVNYQSEPYGWLPNRVLITLPDGVLPSPEMVWWTDTVHVSNDGLNGYVDIFSGELHVSTNPVVDLHFWIEEGYSSLVFTPEAVLNTTQSAITITQEVSEFPFGVWVEGAQINTMGEPSTYSVISVEGYALTVLRDISIRGGQHGIHLYSSHGVHMQNVTIRGELAAPMAQAIRISDDFGVGPGYHQLNDIHLYHVGDDSLTDSAGIYIGQDAVRLNGIIVESCMADGIFMNAPRIDARAVHIANCLGNAVHLQNSVGGRLHNVIAYNNGYGVLGSTSPGVTLHGATILNNEHGGVDAGGEGWLLKNIMVANTGQELNSAVGIVLQGTGHTLVNVVMANNPVGIMLFTNSSRLHDVALLDNDVGVQGFDYAQISVSGFFQVGSNQEDCSVNTGEGLGIVQGPEGSCAFEAPNAPQREEGVTSAHSFVGLNAAGQQPAVDISQWLAADHPWEMFLLHNDGADSFPSPTVRGRCAGAAQCAPYDWRVHDEDTILRARIPAPTDEHPLIQHVWITGEALPQFCDDFFPGSEHDEGPESTGRCHTSFLPNAAEHPTLAPFNDGLCSPGETCIHTSNLGSYHGEGPLIPLSSINLLGQTTHMLEYEVNGALRRQSD